MWRVQKVKLVDVLLSVYTVAEQQLLERPQATQILKT